MTAILSHLLHCNSIFGVCYSAPKFAGLIQVFNMSALLERHLPSTLGIILGQFEATMLTEKNFGRLVPFDLFQFSLHSLPLPFLTAKSSTVPRRPTSALIFAGREDRLAVYKKMPNKNLYFNNSELRGSVLKYKYGFTLCNKLSD